MRIKSFESFLNEDKGKTYSFEELSPEAQENALDNNREINTEDEDWDVSVKEDFELDMGDIGINNIEISYTGFFSQGDGASFTSDDIDTRKFFTAVGIKSNKYLDMSTDDERAQGEDKEFYDLLGNMEKVGQTEDIVRIKPEDIKVTIVRTDSRHYHYNTVKTNVEIWDEPDDWEEPYGFTDELEEKTTEFVRNQCKDLYRMLEKEYDHQNSDEAVKNTLIENDYEFDEEGNTI
jgi:hypothetical protein